MILFCGATKLELVGPMSQRYVWMKKNEAYAEKNILPMVKHGGGLVMLWGCFGSSGTRKLQRVEGKMDLLKYQEILGENVMRNVCEEAELWASMDLQVPTQQWFQAGLKFHQGLIAEEVREDTACKPKNITELEADSSATLPEAGVWLCISFAAGHNSNRELY